MKNYTPEEVEQLQAFSKKKQVGRFSRQKSKKNDIPESILQKFANEVLKRLGIEYWRVPDNSKIKELAGFPDNECLIKISDKYCLSMGLELKTKTGLHGKQVQKAYDQAYTIARTFEEVEAAAINFRNQAFKCRECMKGTKDVN